LSVSSILDKIFAAKRIELEARRRQVSLDSLIDAAARIPAPRPFVDALKASRPAIIAEVKRASPSKGDILPNLNPVAVAADYRASDAAAISVLTDVHFKGSLADLEAVRAAVDLPLLRKDFMFDPYQLYEARASGADCILLIAAMLGDGEIKALAALAHELKMAALVEVHNETEMRRAEAAGATLIGINNRDLHSFKTDIALTETLLAGYRGGALIVSESGIETAADVRRLYDAGARAFLVGESLLRGGHPRARLRDLVHALDEGAKHA
jgi:indole-3-glycerol phosphate synthase